MRWIFWPVAALLAVWALLRTSGVEGPWAWVALVAFTPYVALGSALTLLAATLARDRVATGVLLVTTLVLAGAVTPRYLPDGEHATGRPLRVLSANLMLGVADPEAVLALVRRLRPDVFAVQELTAESRERLAPLRELLPHAVERATPGAVGSAIYSRHPLSELPMLEFGAFRQSRALVRPAGGPEFELVSVHPCAPKPETRLPCWRDGLRALPRGGPRLTVLAGDFNATLDHGHLRELLDSGYRDAAEVTGHGLTATWPMLAYGPVPGVTIDHVLADRRIGVTAFEAVTVPGTDHRAVFAALTLPAVGSGPR
ncbi:endonuclease/exonuclease/phosphatase family protein [Nonomuraea sp. NPDC050328]|uniref:endonuclease/exonuclease/phosphatase family protein n=1 Tax=Nonomuraea sp. NPDC050328 TaxID=3364361 RepID=UPI00379DBE01